MNIYLLNEKSKISMKCGTVVLFLSIKTKAFLLKTEFMSGVYGVSWSETVNGNVTWWWTK